MSNFLRNILLVIVWQRYLVFFKIYNEEDKKGAKRCLFLGWGFTSLIAFAY